MRMNPPPSAGEGGPCVSRGRERGSATLQMAPFNGVATFPEAASPLPACSAGHPPPHKGGGFMRTAAQADSKKNGAGLKARAARSLKSV